MGVKECSDLQKSADITSKLETDKAVRARTTCALKGDTM